MVKDRRSGVLKGPDSSLSLLYLLLTMCEMQAVQHVYLTIILQLMFMHFTYTCYSFPVLVIPRCEYDIVAITRV